MAAANANNTANVSAARGVKGGYFFIAPVGTELPSDYSTPLPPAYKCLGFISSDGYEESVDEDSDELTDINGDVMDETTSKRVESAAVTLAEIKAQTLAAMYGDENVSDKDGMITVRHNGNSHPTFVYALELLLKDNRKWRKVVPLGKSSELDSLKIAASELASRQLTIKYLSSDELDGDTCRDYIQSTETTKA
ncbi:MAG: hypothetical protein SOV20_01165 [Coriobacteriales bacterium]|jgi:hypothetical protein|nr:hypothetical protein [Coriobacteriales bacterium]